MPLIRARSVVQVHPGPPFKSPINTRLFSLFPFRGSPPENRFVNHLSTLRLAGWPYTQGVPRQRSSHNHAARARSSEITRPEEQKPSEGLQAETESVVLQTNCTKRAKRSNTEQKPRIFQERAPIEGNQDAAMKPDETYSPALLLCQSSSVGRAPGKDSVNSREFNFITSYRSRAKSRELSKF